MHPSLRLTVPCILWVTVLAPRAAWAQTDEIQVYNAEIASPGELTLTLHNNYTPDGLREPAFPGAFPPNHVLNGVPEFGYGAAPWLELGMYLPVYSALPGGHYYVESAKLRALFVVPNAHKRRFFYGVNFELSRNAVRWEEHGTSGEIRPIIGFREGPFDFIVNPIFDTGFDGFKRLDFAPSERIAYNISEKWAAALEHYADFGKLNAWLPASEQQQTAFAVFDYNGQTGVEFGVGRGLTGATSRWVVKLMLDWSLFGGTH
jgi:hypothetical protein